MIVGEHTIIRWAEPDDAPALRSFYDPAVPRCCLLDQRREPIFPTTDELREVLAQKEMGRPVLFATEDKTGVVRGSIGEKVHKVQLPGGGILWLPARKLRLVKSRRTAEWSEESI